MALAIIAAILIAVQVGVHLESKSLGQTRRQRREDARARERNRLFWSIRNLEMENYGEWRWFE